MVGVASISVFYWVIEQVATSPECQVGKKKPSTKQQISFALR